MSKIYLVGIGPGSTDYITPLAFKTVKLADVLVGSRRALQLFPDYQGPTLELRAKNMDEMMDQTVKLARGGNTVVVLSTGDPGFSGVLKPIQNLARDVEVVVVPGISSLQLCAARLLLPWDEANLLTLHGKGNSAPIWDVIDNGRPTLVLPDFRVHELAQYLLDNGADPWRQVAVGERLSYPDEKIFHGTLEEAAHTEFSYLCVMVIY
ncbi:MAG: precorrin-6y C5,15-methyltransferase (decarboxylating) subunit CbiE [Euryarchaeota archaeon]|jgi:cobalt-precorrin-7 (C5)-methyltransferase|nr:precorrin-6y C5,15-methyltransferase (decarboxylating) subunit CbiE [Euryarchaeota archaeon]HNS24875.1 precorrin-6y C5,15-methyltransferase (decarboxylating) subunit CbiE [Methanobacteriaceae archaeon]